MKNLKYYIAGFIVLDILVIVVIMLFLFGKQEDRCINNGGIWYQDTCITKVSGVDKLEQVGLIERFQNKNYQIDIRYPLDILNYPEIFDYLKNSVEEIKISNGFDNPKKLEIETASHPWQLNIDMNNFYFAGDIGNIVGNISSYTGGAHSNQSYLTLMFDSTTQEIIDSKNLFKNQNSFLENVSSYTIDKLADYKSNIFKNYLPKDEWILKGASANEVNYQHLVAVPSVKKNSSAGLLVYFPPYAVGSYAEGTYKVFIPSDLFYKDLKENFKHYFVKESIPNQSFLNGVIK